MTEIAERLEAIRTSNPGCRAVALADLNSAVALAVSADPPLARERLDGLCAVAAHVLKQPTNGPAQRASLWAETEIVHFVALTADGDECLICICSSDADIQRLESTSLRVFGGERDAEFG